MYFLRHWWGKEEQGVPFERFAEFIDELSAADEEHPDVSLRHETGWVLSYGRRGSVIFENVEEGEPRHMSRVGPEVVIELWRHLAAGDLTWLESQSWTTGYPKND